MKNFLFYLLKIIMITILLSLILEVLYSKMYLQSSRRSKIGYAYNSKPKTIDVVILGSSRVSYQIVTSMFVENGMEAFNYGMEGSKLFEADLILKLLLEKGNKIKNVIVDVDVTLSSKSPDYSEANSLKFLPYFWDSEIIKDQFEKSPKYDITYRIPFYRYMKYEEKLGFREMLFYGIDKKNNEQENGGYYGLFYSNSKLELDLSTDKPIRNKYYEEIKKICKTNNINLIAIMTPVCENTKGMDYFKNINKIYPEIHNYENVVIDDKYFSSCGHLTDAGARIFTAKILNDFFLK